MSDPAAPNEKPPYWEECEGKDFSELVRFITFALSRRSSPSALREGLPRSEEEFLRLCDMLNAKADALKEPPKLVPPRPVYDGPDAPEPFTPSRDLTALYNEEEKRYSRVDDAIDREEDSGVYFEYLQQQLDETRAKRALLERDEKRKYDERRKPYYQAREAYLSRLEPWQEEAGKESKKRRIEANRKSTVERMYSAVRRAFKPTPTGTLQWDPIPPGEATPSDVLRYYERLQREGRIDKFDQERLDKATALPYVDWLLPRSGLHAYSIFTFAHTEKVLLECPVYGNAVYIINSREERWLAMSKQELIESGEAKKIPHQGKNWYKRVKEALDIQ